MDWDICIVGEGLYVGNFVVVANCGGLMGSGESSSLISFLCLLCCDTQYIERKTAECWNEKHGATCDGFFLLKARIVFVYTPYFRTISHQYVGVT